MLALILLSMVAAAPSMADITTYPIRSLTAAAPVFDTPDDFADLAVLGEAIGDKSLVLLDELTHGEGNVFAYKSRIVRYLHQHKGFDVLVLESGLFDLDKIRQSPQPIADQAPGNLFYMYARSAQMQPLFQYLSHSRTSTRPLALAGFDGRFSGTLSTSQLVPEFRLFLQKQLLQKQLLQKQPQQIFVPQSQSEAYLQQIQQLLDGKLSAATPAIQQKFLNINQSIAAMLQPGKLPGTALEAGFWFRINASLRQMALVSWQQRRFDEHDLAMAANLQWLLDQQYAGRKVIVWGHYIHLNRLGGFQNALHAPQTPVAQRLTVANMTSALAEQTLKNSYVLHFSGAEGSYIDFRDLQEVDVKSSEPMLESTLTRQAGADVFVPLPQNSASLQPLWGHEYKSKLSWQQAQQRFDGMILLQQITPAKLLPSSGDRAKPVAQ
ncbi:erythromycin esterase family protein [Rheinheimera riviphila]|uniref:erythromycin esterase family protein n=1 Tax=Rheinheimera riviphila TaxID=1834037 RepID=UPI0013E3ED6E|nr:erythromycin esterase family protein [Rheinheimera riviphila]